MPFFSTIDIDTSICAVSKKSWLGVLTDLNYAATTYSLVTRIVKRIPTIKDLVKRLKNDMIFRLACGIFRFPSSIFSSFLFVINRKIIRRSSRSCTCIKKTQSEPKKRGRKKKSEMKQYDQQKQEEGLNKTQYGKTIADQLDVSLL